MQAKIAAAERADAASKAAKNLSTEEIMEKNRADKAAEEQEQKELEAKGIRRVHELRGFEHMKQRVVTNERCDAQYTHLAFNSLAMLTPQQQPPDRQSSG